MAWPVIIVVIVVNSVIKHETGFTGMDTMNAACHVTATSHFSLVQYGNLYLSIFIAKAITNVLS